MSLFICSLNSGSNGNCYYVGTRHEAVLVDVGISCREVEKRMKRAGLDMAKVKATFVSHEHSDHIRGIPVLAKKYQLPVYMTAETQRQSYLFVEQHLVAGYCAQSPVHIGNLTVTAFPKFHDACDPHSFSIRYNSIQVGVFTDLGICCPQLIHHFKQCHAAFLEANYDDEMLDKGNYPYHLKRRIRGGKGHLSNTQALELFVQHRPAFMSHLLLAHLSKHNNCPVLVEEIFKKDCGDVYVAVASRYEESPVYEITGTKTVELPIKGTKLQLALF